MTERKRKPSIVGRYKVHRELELPYFNKSVRIRFGTQKHYPVRKQITINGNLNALESASFKPMSIKLLANAGVSVPVSLILGGDEIPPYFYGKKVVYKIPRHSRARGMKVFTLTDETVAGLPSCGYIQLAIEKDREFRVHVADGHVFHIDERYRKRGVEPSFIRNKSTGYKFLEPKTEYPPEIETEAIKAVTALRLDFGAVDVIHDGEKTYVLEVNTAPGLRTKTKEKYKSMLIRLIESRGGVIVE